MLFLLNSIKKRCYKFRPILIINFKYSYF